MKYYTIQASEHLTSFVRCFWFLESESSYTHHSMPDICPELIFHYKGKFEQSFSAGLHAQSVLRRDFYTDKGFSIFGVYLYPHAIPLLFNIPANELTNQMPDLQQLLKGEGIELEEKIALALNDRERVDILEKFIEGRLKKYYTEQLPVFYCIQSIIKNKGLVKISELAGDCYLSERQFERQFKQFSGFNPKLFSRIVRFHNAMSHYGDYSKSLTDIAYECGYYDQSHFINDFKSFSGYHPKQYFSGNSGATEWRD